MYISEYGIKEFLDATCMYKQNALLLGLIDNKVKPSNWKGQVFSTFVMLGLRLNLNRWCFVIAGM